MKTYTATPKDIEHRWFVVDADGMVLGRLAAEIAQIMRGKHKPMFTPHMDTGDNVIVINAAKVQASRAARPSRSSTSSTPATWATSASRPFAHDAGQAPRARDREGGLRHAARRPRSVGRRLRRKLRVYAGADHPHVAQQPTALTFNTTSETK